MKKNLLLQLLLVLSSSVYSQIAFKEVALYNNRISLKVPANWKVRENAMTFAVYEIKYNVEVKAPFDKSGVSLFVYNSQYGPQMQMSDSILAGIKQRELDVTFKKSIIAESGIKVIGGIRVGYLKYTFLVDKKASRAYEIDVFFCNRNSVYHKITIKGLNKPVSEFRKIAETIFNSISINY